jgi:uncharacterized protein DUF1844
VSKEIKVTDKRMFTPEGELREEYRFLAEKATAPEPPPVAPPPPPQPEPARPEPRRGRRAGREPEPPAAPEPSGRIELPGSPPGLGASFFDLAAMLAEPIAVYLGDVELPDGGSAENLEMARLHIDLLDVLREKTAGNLTAQEATFLEDLLYRARVRYVQKQG